MSRLIRVKLLSLVLLACSQPAPVRFSAPYVVYLPFSTTPTRGLRGLAVADISHLEDLTALGAGWWYVWGWFTEMGATPMVREMQMPPTCEPYILVGNEPDAVEPYGHPVAPAEAVERVRAIESACPNSTLVVGNVTGDGYLWLRDFLTEYQARAGVPYSNGIGVHCYTWTEAEICIDKLAPMRALYAGEMWLTEFNVLSSNTAEFSILLEYAAAAFDRYAAYTNRQRPENPGLPNAALIGEDGLPDARGLIYADY